jgi:hypothetical protein
VSRSPDRAPLEHRAFVGPLDLYDIVAAWQFSLLAFLGLREHHTLLDIGCGSLRGGKLFIPYLAPSNYYGIEPNAWLIEDGIAYEVGRDQVALKRPTFSHDPDFTLTTFGRTFDYLLAQSIFSHAGQRQIARCLSQARLVMEPRSMFAATFNEWQPGAADEQNYSGEEWVYPGSTYFTFDRMVELAHEQGLECRRLDWVHPGGQTWTMFTRPDHDGDVAATLAASGVAEPAGPSRISDGTIIAWKGHPNIYIVERGRKRAFQDWESYLRCGGAPDGSSIVALSDHEFLAVPAGPPIPRE